MALGSGTMQSIGGGVSDLFAASGYRLKSQGARLQSSSYDRAAILADENEKYVETSTALKTAQAQRNIYQVTGEQQADIAESGFQNVGSALDIMRDSAAQGALTKAAIAQQGEITEEGYREQERAYKTMSEASQLEASALDKAATGATWSAGLKFAGAFASLAPGGGGGGDGGAGSFAGAPPP